MTAHGIVIAFLLAFPWALLVVIIVGATSSAVRRSLEYLNIFRYPGGSVGANDPSRLCRFTHTAAVLALFSDSHLKCNSPGHQHEFSRSTAHR